MEAAADHEPAMSVHNTTVLIIGAGPAGLATSVCLSKLSIANTILEKEHVACSLWKTRAYDRLRLHVAKQYCHLPFAPPHSPSLPTFMSKDQFVAYVDTYVSTFRIQPTFGRHVTSAAYDAGTGKWRVEAQAAGGRREAYVAEFLVVASGENGGFDGVTVHSSGYRNGSGFSGKDVLVVGCGNSGMEIGLDLCNHGARVSIVVRNPFHVVTRGMVHLGMQMMKYMKMEYVDSVVASMANLYYGDLSKYGIRRPSDGPFTYKSTAGQTPVIDVGTIDKIRAGQIQVVPGIKRVKGTSEVEFADGTTRRFDAIVFATGYRSSANSWLKDFRYIFNEEGTPKNRTPDHWRGENGIYCAGYSKMGINGISNDAEAISQDIMRQIMKKN
ncbi:unnamed protein product [Linum tenue]|uniref:indole-3-pyruvate monooxygenase n=1 Tax=Linum tenue TaxID=586396 RepID=A0AAV0LYZ4_9ROSI|nr:unnamed protein product [Linum tenue]